MQVDLSMVYIHEDLSWSSTISRASSQLPGYLKRERWRCYVMPLWEMIEEIQRVKDGMWGDAEARTSPIKNNKWVTCSTAVVTDESMFAHYVPWYHETHQAVVHAMRGHMTLNQTAQRNWGDVDIVHVELANIKWKIVGIHFIDIIDWNHEVQRFSSLAAIFMWSE
jgi:hypothetical protein